LKIQKRKYAVCFKYFILMMFLTVSISFSGCSCGGSGQKDAVNYDNVRKNSVAKASVSAPQGAAKTDQPREKSVDAPVQKILDEVRRNSKIDVKPVAPGCEAGREKLKKALKEFKFDRDFNDVAMADIVKELSDRTGFKFKTDSGLAEKKLTMRSSGRKLALFIREIEKMGVRIILSPENDILLKSVEDRGGRGAGRVGKREGRERPSSDDKFPEGVRPNAVGNLSRNGDHKAAAQDADVFDDTDIF